MHHFYYVQIFMAHLTKTGLSYSQFIDVPTRDFEPKSGKCLEVR